MRALLDGVRLALLAVVRNPMRATLTVLGILIAVASVVTVDALGQGARARVSKQIESMGSNFILVLPQSSQVSGAKGAQGTGVRLTEEDGRAILRESTSVAAIAPALRTGVQVVFGDRNWLTQAVGTTLPYLLVRNWSVERGSQWTVHDEATRAKVVLLGATVAKNLFGSDDPVGQTVRIGRYPFRVLGVLATKGQAPFGVDQDEVLLMPSSSFRSRVMHTPPGFAGVLMASATSASTTDRAVSQIQGILTQRHRIENGRRPDFVVRTQKQASDLQGIIYEIVTNLLFFVALVSLVVGGIGIMNIMLVSVTERTREIGIRMAIGAREGDIRMQFLVEAVALSLFGGVSGIVAAGAIVAALQPLLGWPMPVSAGAVVVGVGASAATGIAFGFLPARRAAQLDPIVALRHE
ncbi:MAG TPA: ABC transporter permease [Polyangiaceae bacterium]|nr:ABC transporter permease [Polyangiaceae bacterium]